jgi:cytochrome oxidase assembly protein ShyY1
VNVIRGLPVFVLASITAAFAAAAAISYAYATNLHLQSSAFTWYRFAGLAFLFLIFAVWRIERGRRREASILKRHRALSTAQR